MAAEGARRRHRLHDAHDAGCRGQPRQPSDEHPPDGRQRRHLVLPRRRLQEGRTRPRRTGDVGLAYADAKGMRFVSVAGHARASSTTARRWRSSTPRRSTSGSRTGSTRPTSRCCGSPPSSASSGSRSTARSSWPPGMLKALVTKDDPRRHDAQREGQLLARRRRPPASSARERGDALGDRDELALAGAAIPQLDLPSAAPRPTMTIFGTPTSSASPNFTPGETLGRSS